MANLARRMLAPPGGKPGPDEIRLIEALQHGMPLVSRPYAAIAERIGMTEARVMELINELIRDQYIRRYGVVVRHHEAGYRANAMVVWDIADERLADVAHRMKEFPFVTLCYRRPRQPPDWPYNLFCMIHGHERPTVLKNLDHMINCCGWQDIAHEVLFSRRRFKQRGARYISKEIKTLRHGEQSEE